MTLLDYMTVAYYYAYDNLQCQYELWLHAALDESGLDTPRDQPGILVLADWMEENGYYEASWALQVLVGDATTRLPVADRGCYIAARMCFDMIAHWQRCLPKLYGRRSRLKAAVASLCIIHENPLLAFYPEAAAYLDGVYPRIHTIRKYRCMYDTDISSGGKLEIAHRFFHTWSQVYDEGMFSHSFDIYHRSLKWKI